MYRKKFSNQSVNQITKHLGNLLDPDMRYDLYTDTFFMRFTIMESVGTKNQSEKRLKIRIARKGLSKGKRKQMSTKKTTRPKIRSVKKGRTVSLKGRTY